MVLLTILLQSEANVDDGIFIHGALEFGGSSGGGGIRGSVAFVEND